MTDPLTSSSIDRCLAGDRGLLDAMKHARARFPKAFEVSCGRRLLPRPMFISWPEMLGRADDLIQLLDLMNTLS
jgi:hypothetical protein